jgi:hypothetical protein
MLPLFACTGEIETLVVYPDVPVDTSNTTSVETTPSDTTNAATDTGDATGSTEPTSSDDERITPFEGFYELSTARVASDNCGFEDYIQAEVFVSIADRYLPESANVQVDGDTFLIEADDFGTSGPVACLPTKSGFTCDTQTATLDYYFYVLSYAIDFTGEVTTPERIRGRADVRYLELDDTSISVLKALGFELSDCVTEVILEWSWIDW